MTDDLDAILPPEPAGRVSEPTPLSTLLSPQRGGLRSLRTWPPDEPVGPWIKFGLREGRQPIQRESFPRGFYEPVFQPAEYLAFYAYVRSYVVEPGGQRMSQRQASLVLFRECPVCGGCGYVRGRKSDTRRTCPRWSATSKTCEAPAATSTYMPMMAWLMIIAMMFARAKGIA